QSSTSVGTVVDIIGSLIYQHDESQDDPTPEKERLISSENIDEFKEIALGAIQAAVENGVLLGSPNLTYTLHRWKDWSGNKEVREWAKQISTSDEGLLRLVYAFLNVRWVQG